MQDLPTTSEIQILCAKVQEFVREASSWPEKKLQEFRQDPASALTAHGIAVPAEKKEQLRTEVNKVFSAQEKHSESSMAGCLACTLALTIVFVLLTYVVLAAIILVIGFFFPEAGLLLLGLLANKILAALIIGLAGTAAIIICSHFGVCSSQVDISEDLKNLPPRFREVLEA